MSHWWLTIDFDRRNHERVEFVFNEKRYIESLHLHHRLIYVIMYTNVFIKVTIVMKGVVVVTTENFYSLGCCYLIFS